MVARQSVGWRFPVAVFPAFAAPCRKWLLSVRPVGLARSAAAAATMDGERTPARLLVDRGLTAASLGGAGFNATGRWSRETTAGGRLPEVGRSVGEEEDGDLASSKRSIIDTADEAGGVLYKKVQNLDAIDDDEVYEDDIHTFEDYEVDT
ncbi:importin alpha isoform 4 [Striga asiatica]|uniref:Importin alpha isoform 4 n=1 Tax=Striga asiatica TaxID=4170 RepID=A0A5A7R5C7_STRAF|nr:importin alpha isoform 4 [Striga asiatica]